MPRVTPLHRTEQQGVLGDTEGDERRHQLQPNDSLVQLMRVSASSRESMFSRVSGNKTRSQTHVPDASRMDFLSTMRAVDPEAKSRWQAPEMEAELAQKRAWFSPTAFALPMMETRFWTSVIARTNHITAILLCITISLSWLVSVADPHPSSKMGFLGLEVKLQTRVIHTVLALTWVMLTLGVQVRARMFIQTLRERERARERNTSESENEHKGAGGDVHSNERSTTDNLSSAPTTRPPSSALKPTIVNTEMGAGRMRTSNSRQTRLYLTPVTPAPPSKGSVSRTASSRTSQGQLSGSTIDTGEEDRLPLRARNLLYFFFGAQIVLVQVLLLNVIGAREELGDPLTFMLDPFGIQVLILFVNMPSTLLVVQFVPMYVVRLWLLLHPAGDLATQLVQLTQLVILTSVLYTNALIVYSRESSERTEFKERRSRSAARRRLSQQATGTMKILSRLLPESVIMRLLKQPEEIADLYAETTVLFARFSVCELAAARITQVVVDIMQEFTPLLDKLIVQYEIEKVKTVGLTTIVSAGVPIRRSDHAHAIADFALDLRDLVKRFNEDVVDREPLYVRNVYTRYGMQLPDGVDVEKIPPLQVTIGMSSGPLVAGVMSTSGLSWDIFGDTVNVASRMATHSKPGVILCSDASFYRLRDEYLFQSQPERYIKGKGNMHTYILERSRADELPVFNWLPVDAYGRAIHDPQHHGRSPGAGVSPSQSHDGTMSPRRSASKVSSKHSSPALTPTVSGRAFEEGHDVADQTSLRADDQNNGSTSVAPRVQSSGGVVVNGRLFPNAGDMEVVDMAQEADQDVLGDLVTLNRSHMGRTGMAIEPVRLVHVDSAESAGTEDSRVDAGSFHSLRTPVKSMSMDTDLTDGDAGLEPMPVDLSGTTYTPVSLAMRRSTLDSGRFRELAAAIAPKIVVDRDDVAEWKRKSVRRKSKGMGEDGTEAGESGSGGHRTVDDDEEEEEEDEEEEDEEEDDEHEEQDTDMGSDSHSLVSWNPSVAGRPSASRTGAWLTGSASGVTSKFGGNREQPPKLEGVAEYEGEGNEGSLLPEDSPAGMSSYRMYRRSRTRVSHRNSGRTSAHTSDRRGAEREERVSGSDVNLLYRVVQVVSQSNTEVQRQYDDHTHEEMPDIHPLTLRFQGKDALLEATFVPPLRNMDEQMLVMTWIQGLWLFCAGMVQTSAIIVGVEQSKREVLIGETVLWCMVALALMMGVFARRVLAHDRMVGFSVRRYVLMQSILVAIGLLQFCGTTRTSAGLYLVISFVFLPLVFNSVTVRRLLLWSLLLNVGVWITFLYQPTGWTADAIVEQTSEDDGLFAMQNGSLWVGMAMRLLALGVLCTLFALAAAYSMELQARVLFYRAYKKRGFDAQLRAQADVFELLLAQTLPAPILRMVRRKAKSFSVQFNNPTVMLLDIAHFTRISSFLSAEEVVQLLARLFGLIDRSIGQNGVFKIKNIGDAVMAASNLSNSDNAERGAIAMADVALEALEAVAEFNESPFRRRLGIKPLRVRIGLSSGPASAMCVLGKNKFSFDLFGQVMDEVGRMEAGAIPGNVRLGNATYLMLRNHYHIADMGKQGKYLLHHNSECPVGDRETCLDSFVLVDEDIEADVTVSDSM